MSNPNRRKLLLSSIMSAAGLVMGRRVQANASLSARSLFAPDAALEPAQSSGPRPIVISTWDIGLEANKVAWQVLAAKGRALDAVEAGVKVTEASVNCCVGLDGNPDRDGHVTLDACIMDELGNCGSVAFLERIRHPISVARKVMEQTPHVMLVGSGAQQFAVAQGFPLEEERLSANARHAYEEWLNGTQYKPVGPWNHDTIGMVAMDSTGNCSGSCTTSGMGFKMRRCV